MLFKEALNPLPQHVNGLILTLHHASQIQTWSLHHDAMLCQLMGGMVKMGAGLQQHFAGNAALPQTGPPRQR